jgi:hypothetical protein
LLPEVGPLQRQRLPGHGAPRAPREPRDLKSRVSSAIVIRLCQRHRHRVQWWLLARRGDRAGPGRRDGRGVQGGISAGSSNRSCWNDLARLPF